MQTPRCCWPGRNFNPLAPCGARHLAISMANLTWQFSIHSPLAGRDGNWRLLLFIQIIFQSTRPLRGETQIEQDYEASLEFSIHSPLAGRDPREKPKSPVRAFFSIHSPLAGRDCALDNRAGAAVLFNPLAPCGARPRLNRTMRHPLSFQSTRPLRGETKSVPECCRAMVFFNPLAPCGARHASMQQAYGLSDFSIHSPLAGRDMLEMTAIDRNVEVFNPLAPCGARPGGHAGL